MKAGWTSKMKPYGKLSQEELLELPGILTRWDPSVLLGARGFGLGLIADVLVACAGPRNK